MNDKELETLENQPPGAAQHIAMNPLDIPAKDFNAALTRRKKNRESLLDWVRDSLVAGVDYQRIKVKGTFSKPFMSKAGSEKVLAMLGVTPTFPDLKEQLEKLQSDVSMIVLTCHLVNQQGEVVGTGAGGRTMEQDKQDVNKCIKMAQKSAMIDATLRLGGLSELFTQDEDSAQDDVIPSTVGPQQITSLKKLMKEAKMPEKALCKFYEIESLKDLPDTKFTRAKKAIMNRIEKNKAEKKKNDKPT